jgi:riboflavin kinase/FMN adenylyltransferase
VLHRVDHFQDFPSRCRGGVVSIGNFDGVHRGHVQLVECLRSMARARGVPAVAFTFDPHPVSLLRPEMAPTPLTWLDRRVQLLHEHGVDEIIVVRTSLELLRVGADEFFHRVIRDGLGAVAMVEGPNFGFGRDRSGTITTLNRLCAAATIPLEVVDPIEVDGQVVSSSRVRQSLAAGQVDVAARMLGRPHRIRGRVGPGSGRGAGLGFPTANLDACETLVPTDGVYACQTIVAGRTWPVALNIGPNPTFAESHRKVEAHLVGFVGNLIGTALEVDFLARLRDTRRFSSSAELVEQIRRDVDQVAAIAGASRQDERGR